MSSVSGKSVKALAAVLKIGAACLFAGHLFAKQNIQDSGMSWKNSPCPRPWVEREKNGWIHVNSCTIAYPLRLNVLVPTTVPMVPVSVLPVPQVIYRRIQSQRYSFKIKIKSRDMYQDMSMRHVSERNHSEYSLTLRRAGNLYTSSVADWVKSIL